MDSNGQSQASNNKKLQFYEDSCFEFLKKNYDSDLLEILNNKEDKAHYPILVDYITLFEDAPIVGDMLLKSPDMILDRFDIAAKRALIEKHSELKENNRKLGLLTDSLKFKLNIRVRVHSLPVCSELCRLNFPSCKESGIFLCLIGTVVRVSSAKLLEYSKTYICNRCKNTVEVKAPSSRYHAFPRTVPCPNLCSNAKVAPVAGLNSKNPENYSKFRDYQEIKLQEQVQKMDFGRMAKAITVVLEDDLVNMCKPGDDISITGALYLRFKPLKPGLAAESELVCRANSIHINNDQRTCMIINDEFSEFVTDFWKQHEFNPFNGRNHIVASFCPQIYGMYVVKLAMCMVLAGGVSREIAGSRIRGESHILLVGDPGTGKSQLLKYASKLSPRSVLTTGIGTSSAGLTVSAAKDNGEWHLEAGALVLADGGVCCIDEFSCIKEHDRVSIHEAMEQQSISIAKAGMVVKLPTRVTMIAATNPKGKYDHSQALDVNIGISSPLLSRFDVLMVLMDAQNDNWDNFICDFILEAKDMFAEAIQNTNASELWDIGRLQAYIVHVKELSPVISDEATEVICQYYKYQRTSLTRNPARTTVRLLESLRRLSEGHAKLMNRKTVLLHDAITAISLTDASMQSSAIIESSNSLHTTFPEDAMEEYKTQARLILERLDLPHLWETEKVYIDQLKVQQAMRSSGVRVIPGPPPGPSSAPRNNLSTNSQRISQGSSNKIIQETVKVEKEESQHENTSVNEIADNEEILEIEEEEEAEDINSQPSQFSLENRNNKKRRRTPSSSSSSSSSSIGFKMNLSDDSKDIFGDDIESEEEKQEEDGEQLESSASESSENCFMFETPKENNNSVRSTKTGKSKTNEEEQLSVVSNSNRSFIPATCESNDKDGTDGSRKSEIKSKLSRFKRTRKNDSDED